jgi:hypothetical protein
VVPEQRQQDEDRNWHAQQPKQYSSTESHVDLHSLLHLEKSLPQHIKGQKVPSPVSSAADYEVGTGSDCRPLRARNKSVCFAFSARTVLVKKCEPYLTAICTTMEN